MPIISYAQNFEDVLLWRVLKDVEDGFFIDVGAHHPRVDSVTQLFTDHGWHGINIEPLPAECAAIAAARPGEITLNVAVGARRGTVKFHNVRGTGLSTTKARIAAAHSRAGWEVDTLEVPVRTLADICREYASPVIHFLKIDCEGAERDVLRGADFKTYRPWVVLLEATEPNSQIPNHMPWEPLLLTAGYSFVWFDGLNRFYVANEHAEQLGPVLAVPPNVFDDFLLARQMPPPETPADPAAPTPARRIALAARCRDGDDLPRVADAGRIFAEADGIAVQVMHNGLRFETAGYADPIEADLIAACAGCRDPQRDRVFDALTRALPDDATMTVMGEATPYHAAWFLYGHPARRATLPTRDDETQAREDRELARHGLVVARTPAADDDAPTPVTLVQCDTAEALAQIDGNIRAGRVGWVLLSTDLSGDGSTHRQCITAIHDARGIIECEYSPHESFVGSGLILARFGPALASWRTPAISHVRMGDALYPDAPAKAADA